MKLYIMKESALDTLKSCLKDVYQKYYDEPNNKWIFEICKEDPFVEFKDVPDFQLADLDKGLPEGEIDAQNCKIIYEKLSFLSESAASDERLWAGLTHTTFYDYMRKRWGYGYGRIAKDAEYEASKIKLKFFYQGSGKSGFLRNTISKCWWVGRNTFDPTNKENPFEKLDIIGSNDINSKVTEYFRNFSFSANPEVMNGIIDALRRFKSEGVKLNVRHNVRPAMSFLNAAGGAAVIDCLPKEIIANMFYDKIVEIRSGKTTMVNLGKDSTDEEEDEVENSEEESYEMSDGIEEENIAESTIKVEQGCLIQVVNEFGETRKYRYDYNGGKWNPILDAFSGHSEGDTVVLSGKEWKIVSIEY